MESLIRRLSMMYGPKPVLYEGIPLMITNVGDETVGISLRFNSLVNTTPPIIYYNKTGKKNYKKWDLSEIKLDKGNTLYLFGENAVIDSTFAVNGNSLIHLDGKLEALCYNKVLGNSTFKGLFQNVVQLVSVGDVMPNTDTIKTSNPNLISIYESLFEGTNIEEIPAGFIKETRSMNWAQGSMYSRMFANCLSLRIIPQDLLKGQTGNGYGSYVEMFLNCEVLEVAADIYLSTQGFRTCIGMYQNCKKITEVTVYTTQMLSNHCMLRFVQGCESLKKIEIKASTNTSWGIYYSAMQDCISLQEVKVSFDTWRSVQNLSAVDMTSSWMKGVSPIGTFICPKELAEATDGYYDEEGNFVEGVGRGESTVPVGWTIDYPIIDARDGDANAMALMAVISQQYHADGITRWVKDPSVMMKSEAEKVESIGTVFRDNKSIKNFEALKYFTKITSIPDNAFYGCSNLTKINIPIQVTHLGTKSFGVTPQLGKIPNHITTFGNYPFYYSTLTSIDISEIKVSSTGSIFQNMYKLRSIELPDQITEISDSAFMSCSALTSFHVHKDITKIGIRPFLNTNGSIKSITVADDNPIYDSREDCNAIIETATNTLIAGCAKTIIPDGIKEIREGALQGVGLESLTIPSSVTTIGNYCFSGYKGTFIEFPDTIVSNGTQIISDAPNLQEAIVGVNIVNIQSYSFYKCPNLTKLTLKAKSVVIAHNTSLTNTNANLVVYVPSELITAYQEDSFWSKFNIQAIPQ